MKIETADTMPKVKRGKETDHTQHMHVLGELAKAKSGILKLTMESEKEAESFHRQLRNFFKSHFSDSANRPSIVRQKEALFIQRPTAPTDKQA